MPLHFNGNVDFGKMKQQISRKLLRIKYRDYAKPDFYFLTLCSKDRLYLFADEIIVDGEKLIELNDCGVMVDDHIKKIGVAYSHVQVDCYTVMPNHVHLIVRILAENMQIDKKPVSIPQIVHAFKVLTTKKFGDTLWQRSYYEHIIRDRDSLNEIRMYIKNNLRKWKEDRFYQFV